MTKEDLEKAANKFHGAMDKYDEMAAGLLPRGFFDHNVDHRAALMLVAAKLREMGTEIEHLRKDADAYASLAVAWNTLENKLRAEIEKWKSLFNGAHNDARAALEKKR